MTAGLESVAEHLDLLDALDLAGLIMDPAGGLVGWNGEAEELFGWTADEVLGRNVLEFIRPADGAADFPELLARVAGGEPGGGDRVVVRRDGQTIRIRTRARPLRAEDGEIIGIVSVVEDVTGRRLAEQQAREVSSHLALALDAGRLGTWRWTIATGELIWDERMERLFGLAPGSFPGTFDAYVALIHPEDRDEVLTVIDRAVSRGEQVRVQHRVIWPDGTVRWLSRVGGPTFGEDGEVTGTIGCAEDVTERVELEAERQRRAQDALAWAEAERLERERLEFLGAINDALNSSSTVEDIMQRVTRAVVPHLADWCALHVLPADDGDVPAVEIAHRDPEMVALARDLRERFPYDPDAPTGVPAVIRSGRTEFYPAIDQALLDDLEVTGEPRDVVERLALRSAITVPVTKRGRILGAMQFVMAHSSRHYTEADVKLAEAVGVRIAVSIENRRLQERQRHVSLTLQASLLPPSLPELPGMDVAARYWPAGEGAVVGGDFYDVFRVDEEQWAIGVGDVCGTGPEAAAVTGLARHTIRSALWHGDGPAETLRTLNRAMVESDFHTFCTAVIASVRRVEGHVVADVASGGHPHPVLVTADGARTVGGPGQLLGLFPSVKANVESVTLAPGDTLVFYTDGATDLPPPYGLTPEEMLDLVAASVGPGPGSTAESIAEAIRRRLEHVQPFVRRDDDLALLILRVRHDDGSAATGPGGQTTTVLAGDRRSPGLARGLLRRQLEERGLSELTEDAELMVSELVTNAVLHGGGEVAVTVQTDDALRVTVEDAGSASEPHIRTPEGRGVGGLGLRIVDTLADRWGTSVTGEGRRQVWFELDRRAVSR